MSGSANERKLRHQSAFKNSGVDGRRKREEKRVQIRKTKKSALLKRRRLGKEGHVGGGIAEICRNIADPAQFLSATTALRKLLSIAENPPLDAVVATGVTATLVGFLAHPNTELQLEAAWALTNIASGSSVHAAAVVDAGGAKAFCSLLLSPNEGVREQCIWGVGNIAGDSCEARDLIISMGGLAMILRSLQYKMSVSVLRTATWALSNFCRGKPGPDMNVIAPALPILAQLTRSSDNAVLIDALWSLSYLTDASDEQIERVVATGFLPSAIALMAHPNLSIQVPAVRLLGNVVSGHEKLTQRAIDAGVVLALRQTLESRSKGLRKETCWAISNLAAGSSSQMQELLKLDFVPAMQALLRDGEMEVRKEAGWVLSNLASGNASAQQRKYLARCGLHRDMCTVLADEVQAGGLYKNALDGLRALLRFSSELRADVVECGGVDRIGDLQEHAEHGVYEAAVGILEEFFEESMVEN